MIIARIHISAARRYRHRTDKPAGKDVAGTITTSARGVDGEMLWRRGLDGYFECIGGRTVGEALQHHFASARSELELIARIFLAVDIHLIVADACHLETG